MAFHSMTVVCSDELQCTVCLQLYKKPVTLPCGHSFCYACIENHWGSREVCNCPNCREVFTKRPELKKNVVLASLVEQLKLPKTPVKPEVDVQVEDIEHHCEVCNGMAAKLCVPCEITCCEIHVKPHEQKGHKLVEPGVNVEELSCTKHGKPIELYCKDDESLMCVMCMMCTAAQHENHNIVPVDIVHAEFKGVLTAKCSELSKSNQHLESKLHQLQQEVEKTQHSGVETVGRLEEKRMKLYQFVDKFVDLMKSRVIKSQSEKISLLQKQMDEVKEQLNSLHEANSTLKTALQDLETISFLQGYKDLIKRLESVSHFQPLKMAPPTALDFSNEEANLDSLIELSNNFLKDMTDPTELKISELDQSSLRSLYGWTPSLDPNSAHSEIMISQDLRTATRPGTEQPYPEHPDRFTFYPQVVSSESFSSGCHYWEVDVSLSGWWETGVALNSIERKGESEECLFGGNPKSWCLVKCNNEYSAWHNKQRTLLSMPEDPDRLGFLLDCEAGELTCFGDSWVLHMFKGNFTDQVKAAIGVYDNHESVRFCSF